MDKLRVEYGRTVNRGDFNSERVSYSIEVEVDQYWTEKKTDIMNILTSWADEDLGPTTKPQSPSLETTIPQSEAEALERDKEEFREQLGNNSNEKDKYL